MSNKGNKPQTPQAGTTQNQTTQGATVQRPTSEYIQNSMQSAGDVKKGKK